MKQNLKTITLGLILATTLFSSCEMRVTKSIGEKDKAKSQTADQGNQDLPKEIIEVSANQPANELADAAEQLVGPYTFMLAARIADMALVNDSSNLKAQFYKKFLARMEVFRGIAYRVKTLIKVEEQAKWQTNKDNFPESPLKAFLYDEKLPVLKDVADVQDILGQYGMAVREFRTFLKKNVNSQMVINLNPHIFEEKIKKDAAKDCQVSETTDGRMSFACNTKTVAQVRLNSADFIGLAQMQAGELLYFGMLNSYSLNGIEKANVINHPELKTPEQTINFLLANEKFGKLRKDNTITMLKEIGSDFSAAAKWAMHYQNQLCPLGSDSTADQRRGYLFSSGFCVKDMTESQKSLALLDQALAGVISVDLFSSEGTLRPVNLDIFAWSKAPIQDIRSVAPKSYNACGHVSAIKDNTVGGIFVDNNFADLLNKEICN